MADEVSASVLLMDELLQHQVYLERYQAGEVKQLQQLLAQLQDDVVAQLAKRLPDVTSVRSTQMQALLKDMQALSDDAAKQQTDYVAGQLKDLTAYETGFNVSAFRAILPVTVSTTTVAPSVLWTLVKQQPFQGRVLNQWFKDYTVVQKQRLSQAVTMGVVEGETIDQMVRRVRGTKAANYTDGVLTGVQRNAAEALVRTATNHVTTTARQATIQANAEVVSQVLWRSTLDGRTTPICRARDGKTYPIDSGPRPPAHPRCRSTIVPVLKSWQELGLPFKEMDEGTRASMNGQVPETETYQTWLQRQPASFQDEVLGSTRGKLFRKGGLTLDRFVDEGTTREYSLDQLRRQHPEAFKQAGL